MLKMIMVLNLKEPIRMLKMIMVLNYAENVFIGLAPVKIRAGEFTMKLF